MFDMGHIVEQKANIISGGECQRTAIARAMANRPRSIPADETASGLDKDKTESVISMLQLAREKSETQWFLRARHQPLEARYDESASGGAKNLDRGCQAR